MKTSLPVEHLIQWRDEQDALAVEYSELAESMISKKAISDREGWLEYVDNVRAIYLERVRIINALIDEKLAE